MNWAHWHLLLNHLPVIGTPFAIGLEAFAVWRKSDEMEKASAGCFVAVALLTIPAYLTGCPAKRLVRGLPGVSQSFVHQHENAALIAALAVWGLGSISLLALFLSRRSRPMPRWFAPASLMAGIVAAGLMAWTANLGGQIRHTEIRSGASAAASAPAAQRKASDE